MGFSSSLKQPLSTPLEPQGLSLYGPVPLRCLFVSFTHPQPNSYKIDTAGILLEDKREGGRKRRKNPGINIKLSQNHVLDD